MRQNRVKIIKSDPGFYREGTLGMLIEEGLTVSRVKLGGVVKEVRNSDFCIVPDKGKQTSAADHKMLALPDGVPLCIKKYNKNRKLYCTNVGGYVSVSAILKLAKSCRQFKIVCASTHLDITSTVLLRACVDEIVNTKKPEQMLGKVLNIL